MKCIMGSRCSGSLQLGSYNVQKWLPSVGSTKNNLHRETVEENVSQRDLSP